MLRNCERILSIRPGFEMTLADTTGMAIPDHVGRLAARCLFGEQLNLYGNCEAHGASKRRTVLALGAQFAAATARAGVVLPFDEALEPADVSARTRDDPILRIRAKRRVTQLRRYHVLKCFVARTAAKPRLDLIVEMHEQLRLGARDPSLRPPGHPWPAVGFLAMVAGLLLLLAMNNPLQAVLGVAIVSAGIPAYHLIAKRDQRRAAPLEETR